MKNVKRGSVKYLLLLIVAIIICGIILYPLFDLLYYKVIINSDFYYDIYRYIINPIIYGTILGIVLWFLDCKKK